MVTCCIVDKGNCSLQFPKEHKVVTKYEKYDYFGPTRYLQEIKKIQLSKEYTTISVLADSDEVQCLFVPLDKFHRIPLYERPIIRKILIESAKQYEQLLY